MSTDTDSRKIKWITESIIIALIPVLAYVLTFSYEFGSADYYKLPVQFISITIINIFDIGMKIVFQLVVIYSVVRFFIKLKPKRSRSSVNNIVGISIGIISLLILIGHGIFKNTWILYVFMGLFLVALFLESIFELPSRKNAKDDLSSIKNSHFNNEKFMKSPESYMSFIFVFLFLIGIVYGFGYLQAKKKVEYLVINNSTEQVVVKIYDDNIITVPFNRETKIIKPEFSIQKMGDSKVVLKLEQIGPLSIDKNKD